MPHTSGLNPAPYQANRKSSARVVEFEARWVEVGQPCWRDNEIDSKRERCQVMDALEQKG